MSYVGPMAQKRSRLLLDPCQLQELEANRSLPRKITFVPCCQYSDRFLVLFVRELGDGSNGQVVSAEVSVGSSPLVMRCALKVPKCHSILNNGLLVDAVLVSRAHSAAPHGRHPHVVAYHAILTTNVEVDSPGSHRDTHDSRGEVTTCRVDAIAMDRYPSTLHDRLSDVDRPLSMHAVRCIASQIFSAVSSAHAVHVAHGDLKPGNIFLKHGADDIALGDFGAGYADGVGTAAPRGAPAFAPPEAAAFLTDPDAPRSRPGEYDCFAADVWSFGMVCLCMAFPRTTSVLIYEELTAAVLGAGESAVSQNFMHVTARVISHLKMATADPSSPLFDETFAQILALVFVDDPAQRGTVEQLRPLVTAGAAADTAARSTAQHSADDHDRMTARDVARLAQDAQLAARVQRQLQASEGTATEPLALRPPTTAGQTLHPCTAAAAAAPPTATPPPNLEARKLATAAAIAEGPHTAGPDSAAAAACQAARLPAQHAQQAPASDTPPVATPRCPAGQPNASPAATPVVTQGVSRVFGSPPTPVCAAGPAAAAADPSTPGAIKSSQPTSAIATPGSGMSTGTTQLGFSFAADAELQPNSTPVGWGPETGSQAVAIGSDGDAQGTHVKGATAASSGATDIAEQEEEAPVSPITVPSRILEAMAAAKPNLKRIRHTTDEAPPCAEAPPRRPLWQALPRRALPLCLEFRHSHGCGELQARPRARHRLC